MEMKGPNMLIGLFSFSQKSKVLHSTVSQLYATEASNKVCEHFHGSSAFQIQPLCQSTIE